MNSKGFTLIELVTVIVVLSFLAITVGMMLGEAYTSTQEGKQIMDADWQSMVALNRMGREIREERSLTTIGASNFVFKDIDDRSINYNLVSSQITRTQGSGSARVLADGVNTLTFTYLDQNGATTATAANVRCIEIDMNITQGGTNKNFETLYCPRFLTRVDHT